MPGYISIYRDIREHWIWEQGRPRTKLEAWIDLIMLANYKSKNVSLGVEIIPVQRGSFITSELKLMDRWKWSKSKVRAFLKALQNDGMIVKKTDRRKTTLIILNYELYQDAQTEKEPPKDRKKTDKKPRKDTTNNINKENKNNNIYSAQFEVFWSAYPKKRNKEQARVAFEKLMKIGEDFNSIVSGVKNYGKICATEGTELKFIANASTFLNQQRYKEYADINTEGGTFTDLFGDEVTVLI